MAEGVRAGKVFYELAFSRESLQKLIEESKRVGKQLGEALKPAAGTTAGGKKPLDDLTKQARESAQELRRLADEEKAGIITREQYRKSVTDVNVAMRSQVQEVTRGTAEYDALTQVLARSDTALQRLAKQDATETIQRLGNSVASSRNEFEKGSITQEEFVKRMNEAIETSTRMGEELVMLQGESARSSREFRQIAQAGGMAERGLATVEGRVSKLGLSQQIVVGGTQLLNRHLQALGPIGSAAGAILLMLEKRFGGTGGAAGGAAVGIQFFNQRTAALTGLVATGLVSALVVGTAAIMRLTASTAEWAEQVQVATNRTGLSAEQYQEYAFSANQAGLTTEVMTTILQRLQRRAADAHAGNANLKRSFDQLGVTLTDRNGEMLSTEELLSQVADGLAGVDNNAERLRLTFSILDQEGASALEWLLQGSENMAEMRDRARELGLVISNEGVQSLFDYGGEIAAVQEQFQALTRGMVVEFLPYLRDDVVPFIRDKAIPVFRTTMELLGGVGRMFGSAGGKISENTANLVAFAGATAGINAGLRTLMNLLGIAFPQLRAIIAVVSAATAAYGLWKRASIDTAEVIKQGADEINKALAGQDPDSVISGLDKVISAVEGPVRDSLVELREEFSRTGDMGVDMASRIHEALVSAQTAPLRAQLAGLQAEEAAIRRGLAALGSPEQLDAQLADLEAVIEAVLDAGGTVSNELWQEHQSLKLLQSGMYRDESLDARLAAASQARLNENLQQQVEIRNELQALEGSTGVMTNDVRDETEAVGELLNTLANLEKRRAELTAARREVVIDSDEYQRLTEELHEVEAAITAATQRAQDSVKAKSDTKAERTIKDVFDDIAAAGLRAEQRALALGNTTEAQAESVGTRIGLINNGITELIAMGVSATDDKVQYLVTRLAELQAELAKLNATPVPVEPAIVGIPDAPEPGSDLSRTDRYLAEAAAADVLGASTEELEDRLLKNAAATRAVITARENLAKAEDEMLRRYRLLGEDVDFTGERIRMLEQEIMLLSETVEDSNPELMLMRRELELLRNVAGVADTVTDSLRGLLQPVSANVNLFSEWVDLQRQVNTLVGEAPTPVQALRTAIEDLMHKAPALNGFLRLLLNQLDEFEAAGRDDAAVGLNRQIDALLGIQVDPIVEMREELLRLRDAGDITGDAYVQMIERLDAAEQVEAATTLIGQGVEWLTGKLGDLGASSEELDALRSRLEAVTGTGLTDVQMLRADLEAVVETGGAAAFMAGQLLDALNAWDGGGRELAEANEILEQYHLDLELAEIAAAAFGETHELAGEQAGLTRSAIEALLPLLGAESDEVQQLVADWKRLTKQQSDADEAKSKLVDTLGDYSAALKTVGGSASGPLGDFLTGLGDALGVAQQFARGDLVGGFAAVAASIISGFTAGQEAARNLRDEIEGIQDSFSLIDVDRFIKTTRERVGSMLWIFPVYGEVVDESVTNARLAFAEAVESGVMGGLEAARDIAIAGGSREEMEAAIRDGLEQAVIDAIWNGLVQGAALEGILGDKLAAITQAAIDGDWDRAREIAAGMGDDIERAADLIAGVFDPFAESDTFTNLSRSIADAIQSGLESGLSRGVNAYLESGNIADLTFGLQQGVYDSVTTALVNSLIESTLIQGALSGYMTQIAEAFAAGDTERAAQLSQEMMGLIPEIAGQIAEIIEPFRGLKPENPSSPAAGSRTGGVQVSEITGPTRDLLLTTLAPLAALDYLPSILDRIYNVLDTRLPAFAGATLPGASVVRAGDNIEINITVPAAAIGSHAQATTLGNTIADQLRRELRGRGK